MLAGRPASAPLGQSSLRELDSFPAVVSGAFSVALFHHQSGPSWGSQCCLAQMLPGSTDLGWTFQQWWYPSPLEVTGWGDQLCAPARSPGPGRLCPRSSWGLRGPWCPQGRHLAPMVSRLVPFPPPPHYPDTPSLPPRLPSSSSSTSVGINGGVSRQEPPRGSGTPEHFHFFTRRRVSLVG